MSKIVIIGGGVGAGKSTYAKTVAPEIGALRFVMDDWMKRLFLPDLTALSYDWMIERVDRCEAVMWDLAEQQLALSWPCLFDCGFMEREQRQRFAEKAAVLSVPLELHWLEVEPDVRWDRVQQRNREKSDSYAFEVTRDMFDFMEQKLEQPAIEEAPVRIF